MRELKKRIGLSKSSTFFLRGIEPTQKKKPPNPRGKLRGFKKVLDKISPLVKFLKSGAGFTLIELLTVIAVIGLMVVGIVTLVDPLSQIKKSQDARRKSDLSQIQKSLEVYHQDNGKYPPVDTSTANYRIKRLDSTTADWGTQFQPYMSILPQDPSSSKNYVYNTSSDRQTYYIYASLDRDVDDPQVCNSGAACSSLPSGASCGAGTCNYGVSSQNVSP